MDTNAFLLEREAIVRRLQDRRAASLAEQARTPQGLFGMSWGELASLFLNGGAGSRSAKWLTRLALTGLAPLVIGYVQQKGLSYLQRRQPLFGRLGRLFTLFTSRI